ncbi:hypothetical protein Ciccas_004885 [Cichlidogyrus casuarinus]|uniref:Uncharacterized protein n=1 Tax=Cichlidogyrus casuarinus TaxID=1844966 RepID=A0ABD2QDQ8_9PLAT
MAVAPLSILLRRLTKLRRLTLIHCQCVSDAFDPNQPWLEESLEELVTAIRDNLSPTELLYPGSFVLQVSDWDKEVVRKLQEIAKKPDQDASAQAPFSWLRVENDSFNVATSPPILRRLSSTLSNSSL